MTDESLAAANLRMGEALRQIIIMAGGAATRGEIVRYAEAVLRGGTPVTVDFEEALAAMTEIRSLYSTLCERLVKTIRDLEGAGRK